MTELVPDDQFPAAKKTKQNQTEQHRSTNCLNTHETPLVLKLQSAIDLARCLDYHETQINQLAEILHYL